MTTASAVGISTCLYSLLGGQSVTTRDYFGRNVAIIDPYSSGNLLAPELRRWGVNPISVLSQHDFPTDILASQVPQDFAARDRYVVRDRNEILAELRRRNVLYVLPGSETGVLLSDWLNEQLGLRMNDPALSLARRRKYEMAEAIRPFADAVRQFQSSDLAEIERLIVERGLGSPIVMKPPMSAGTDGFHLTTTQAQREQALRTILSLPNAYNQPNDLALVQEYLDGPEYMVDTMSLDGQMIITDAALYEKTSANGSDAVYEGARFVPYEELERHGIPQYLRIVHWAVGIFHGPGHPEVKIVNRNGRLVPVLVEIGARMAGGGVPVLARAACGSSQLETWMETLFAPERFRARIGRPYQFRGGRMVCLIARRAGTLKRYKYEAQIRALPTFFRWKMRVNPGQPLPLTTNFLNYPGHVELVGEPADVDRDREELRRLEALPDFYELE